jgi:hypothetical protein
MAITTAVVTAMGEKVQEEAGERGMDKQKRMERLRTEALTCPECPNRARRLRVVFGEGDVNAPVMLVGQGPPTTTTAPNGCSSV